MIAESTQLLLMMKVVNNLLYTFFNRNSRKDFRAFFRQLPTSSDPRLALYGNLYQNIEGFSSGLSFYAYHRERGSPTETFLAHRQRLMDELVAEHEKKAGSSEQVIALLRRYGVRYVVWDQNLHPEWDVSFLGPIAKERVVSHGIHLYELQTL